MSLRAALVKWYRAARRDLPWRRTRDPYAIWISEVMLQQTRVDTVIPYYERFLQNWPTAAALAAADPEDVRASWSGLGYYRRARLMMDAAAVIAADHAGELPRSVDALRALPGFGRYTAGAVASIAYDLPAPAVDGNTSRVLARINGIRGDVSKGPPNQQVWSAATALAGESPAESAGDLTQALIELGATVCTTVNPGCGRCPVTPWCTAQREGMTGDIPPPRKRAARKRIEVTAIVALPGPGRIVLEQRPDGGILAGLWSPPLLDGHLEPDSAADEAERRWGWVLDGATEAGSVKHVLTHRDIMMQLVLARCTAAPPGLRVFDLDALDRIGIPSVTTRALKRALPQTERDRAVLPGRRTKPQLDLL